jgi:hypothetical protein
MDTLVNSYTLVLIPAPGSTASTIETIDCASDAEALSEACKYFIRAPEIDVIEVWDDGRKVVSLGGRNPPTRWH